MATILERLHAATAAASTATDPELRAFYVSRARTLLTQAQAEVSAAVIVVEAQEAEIRRVTAEQLQIGATK
jgi:hypothetical protein